ncbi:AbgT family transporter [Romboutsia weinsteinii]|uniref:AbgT family transporter n=1 Tax=Romboutsia weinsteinii TaxID=2020949 RepID=A0A371J0Y2_9FIRM|nr:AbgT family transporter [Romboutsia weinsteinii]RDY26328.1 AbgT family transporter [Romboutsia weinsteinii]
MGKSKSMKKKGSVLDSILNWVEKVGNKLPDPVTIFIILSVVVFILSAIISSQNVSAIHPSTGETIQSINLLSKEQIQIFMGSIVSNFQSFAPLGLVLVTMLGAGVAEKTGLMETLMKCGINKVPKSLVTVTVIFAGVVANAVADAGFVVLPPLAAIVFIGVGRHPLLGMFAGYAGVAAGFAANVTVSMIDVLLAGFTIPSAQMIDPNYVGNPAMNLYFLLLSAVVLTILGAFVTERFIAPRFENHDEIALDKEENNMVSDIEAKGLKYAIYSILIMAVVLVGLSLGENAFLKDPETGSILSNGSTLMKGIVPIITIVFLVPGFIYGKVTKTIKNDKDLVSLMGASMSDMGSYIVLAFVAGQFLYLFNSSNLGTILSIKGAEWLQNIGMTGKGLFVIFVLFAAFINLFVGSASAKWAIMAPIFVPMFLLLGYDPALTQVAYRIGDSITNPLSPLFPYFPMLLAFAKRYDKNIGMGTIISSMLPYSVVFGIAWIILLIIFMALGLPLGPGGGIFYTI